MSNAESNAAVLDEPAQPQSTATTTTTDRRAPDCSIPTTREPFPDDQPPIEPAPYQFLYRCDTPLIEALIEFRDVVTDLRPTVSTINPSLRFDTMTANTLQKHQEIVEFAGSWPIPDWFTGSGNGVKARFANPYSPSATYYTLAGARCSCGRLITDIAQSTPIALTHDTSRCTPADRERVRKEVERIRLRHLIRGANMTLPLELAARRVGLSRKAASHLCRRYELSWKKLRRIGRWRMAVTTVDLRERGYSQATLAEAFDCSPRQIQRYEQMGMSTPADK